MIKISEVVREIFYDDDNAKVAAGYDVLSVTNYARKIKPQVQEKLLVDVNLKSIVVALHRILKKFEKDKYNLAPNLQNISIHSNIVEITLEKNNKNIMIVNKLRKFLENHHAFYTLSSSVGEVTLLVDQDFLPRVRKIAEGEIIMTEENLSGITVKFGTRFIKQPMLFYELIKRVSLNQINIMEIASTATELTFFIDKNDTEKAVGLLSKFL